MFEITVMKTARPLTMGLKGDKVVWRKYNPTLVMVVNLLLDMSFLD
jgi:hypothetical protein